MKGKTSKGFEFEVSEEALDNMELVEIIAGVDENPLLFPKLCEMMLGKEQKRRLYEYFRTEDGRVPIEDISDTVQEIFNTSDDSKN